jgi:hypothetical protein
MALRYKPWHCHLMMLVLEEGEHCSRPHLQPLLQLLLADQVPSARLARLQQLHPHTSN